MALSPNGTDVAVEIFDRSGAAVVAVWTFNLERGTFNRVTNEPGLTVSPLWTLDGRRIVYGSGSERGEGSEGLFWRNADGTGDPERLVALDGASTVSPWAWSPDGAWLLFRGRTGSMSDSDIGMISMEGDRSVEWLFDSVFGETHPSISPDGDWIAYTSDRSPTGRWAEERGGYNVDTLGAPPPLLTGPQSQTGRQGPGRSQRRWRRYGLVHRL